MDITFLLVDGLNLIRRVYAAQPGEDGFERVESALRASVKSLSRALRECRPTHAVCVFDGDEPGWRHEEYPSYKSGRQPMPEALREGLPSFRDAFGDQGVASLVFPALEADDVIATLACKVAERGGHSTILSTDKAFLQLLSNYIVVRDHFQKINLDDSWIINKYGVEAGQFVDFLALAGDTGNSIPGVPSVGAKTAARLLREVGDLDTILAVAHTIPGKPGEMIYKNRDQAQLSRLLAILRKDLELGVNLKSFRYLEKS